MGIFQKTFYFIIETIFWIQLFLAPVFASVLVGLIIGQFIGNYKLLAVILLPLGIIGGIVLAERIRRKYGCADFFGRLYRTSESEPDKE